MISNSDFDENLARMQFEAMRTDRQKLSFMLQYAVLAPSVFNSQPWIWKLDGDSMNLYIDLVRSRPVADPENRELAISCGAALFYYRLALRHFGFSEQVTYFPEREGYSLVNVRLGSPTNISEGDERLFRSIFTRHTNRGPFREELLPSSLVHTLRHDTYRDGIRIYVLESPEVRQRLVNLIRKGNLIKWDNRNYRREMAHWVRPNNSESVDGISGNTLGLGDVASRFASLALPLSDMAETQADRDWQRSEEAPALLVLASDRDTPDQWLKVGEALAKVLLRANSEGLQASYFNQPIELHELRPELQAIIGHKNYPQLLFRLGYPCSSSSITHRRGPADVQMTTR